MEVMKDPLRDGWHVGGEPMSAPSYDELLAEEIERLTSRHTPREKPTERQQRRLAEFEQASVKDPNDAENWGSFHQRAGEGSPMPTKHAGT